MRIRNPNFTRPINTTQRTALLAFLAANPSAETFTLDALRSGVPALAGLRDGVLMQLTTDAGLTLEPGETP